MKGKIRNCQTEGCSKLALEGGSMCKACLVAMVSKPQPVEPLKDYGEQ